MSESKMTRRQVLAGMGALGTAALLPCREVSTPSVTSVPSLEVTSSHAKTATPVATDTVHLPLVTSTPPPSWNGLSFIIIMCDTLRYDHIGFHGNSAIETPNIDAFAAQAQVFDRAYSGGFPTLLNRAELFTGRYTFAYMGWEDLPADEVVLAKVLNDAGYSTGLVFDTPHFKANQFSFDRDFSSWRWVRGQEKDRYQPTPLNPEPPAAWWKLRHGKEVVQQYLRNVARRQAESDYFVAKTMQTAKEWLRDNYSENNFFLHVDSFDPHEPWDPPQAYIDLYNPGYSGDQVIYPAYAPPAYFLTADELNHVRALYAAEVTIVDRWLGELFDEIGRLGLWDKTVVVLTSDHGILLGEQDGVGKAWDHEGHYQCYHLYEELVHVPLMIRVPGVPPKRILDLAQPADLMPTILEWAGARDPGTVQGASLVPAIEDTDGSSHTPVHDTIVSSRSVFTSASAKPSCTVTDGEWALIHGGSNVASELYYLHDDPQQQVNLLSQNCTTARDLHAELVAFLESIGTAEQYLSPWRVRPC